MGRPVYVRAGGPIKKSIILYNFPVIYGFYAQTGNALKSGFLTSNFLNRFSQNHFVVILYNFPAISGFMDKPEIPPGNALKSGFLQF